MYALNAAVATFRKEFLAAEADTGMVAFPFQKAYSLRAARVFRYSLFWAFYEGTPYDGPRTQGAVQGTHTWAAPLKAANGLYKDTRPILNPAYRLGEFWATHLYGGRLDPLMGDGTQVTSAIPIVDASDPLRAAMAQLLTDSQWQIAKTTWCRQGSVLGDAFLVGVDDPELGPRLKPLHPRFIADLTKDGDGNITRYVREEWRDDPQAPEIPLRMTGTPQKQVLYTELAELDRGAVTFKTYLNYAPFAWNGVAAEWTVPYPFMPLWHVQNIDIGLGYGMAEFFPLWHKAAESDDQISKLNDQIRKTVESIWFFSGIRQQDLDAATKRVQASYANPQSGRQEMLSIAATDVDAKAQALVAELDIAGASNHLRFLVESYLQDYPELRYELIRATGDASAKAIQEARKPAEAKVEERRAGYDAMLTRALQGAIAIGGYRYREASDPRLKVYAPFDLDSLAKGDLHFHIGPRPVFKTTPADRAEEDTAIATQVKTWVDAGVPLPVALKRAGWDDATIAEIERRQKDEEEAQAERMARLVDQVPEGVTQ